MRRVLDLRTLAAVLLALTATSVLAACAGTKPSDTASSSQKAGRAPGSDEVRLVVSRDFGATVLRDVVVPATGKLDVMRLLAENADVETAYGGGFVNAIDGLKSSFGATSDRTASDWFYWVDGSMADVGALGWKLKGGETVWWDYHRWSDAMFIPQALAAFPRPYTGGELPVAAAQDVPGLQEWAAGGGLRLGARQGLESQPSGGLVLATASQAAATPWLTELLSADQSGLAMVKVGADSLSLLSPDGASGPGADAIAVAAPNFDDPDHPILVVLGRTVDDIQTCLSSLTTSVLTAKIGLAIVQGKPIALPWGAGK